MSWFPLYRIAAGGWSYWNYLRDRRYTASDFLYWGEGVKLGARVLITAPERLYLGDGTVISEHCTINAIGGCHVGKYCGFGPEVWVLTTEHKYTGAECLPFGSTRIVKPVYIEDYVWIGARASILPGVRIGEGAIVGLGSVVTADVLPLSVVMGNPATIIGHRRKHEYERLKAAGAARHLDQQCSLLWVPPFIRSKYPEELKEFGFDVGGGQAYFRYNKYANLAHRMAPCKRPDGPQLTATSRHERN
jgi:acetyltransferase-like isoleucine patch superfamily enzyme